MKGRLITGVLTATLLAAALPPAGCGYFLYPERRGNSGGRVDGAILVMDLLWLLPGLVPGVIALVVDFSSGAVYTSRGGRSAVLISPKGHVAVRLPASSQPTQVDVRLVTADRRVLANKTVVVGPNVQSQSVELQIGDAMPSLRNETIYLEIATAKGSARFPTALEVAQ